MTGTNDEFTLAAAVQNLRRLAKLNTQGPPTTGQVRPQSAEHLKSTY
jgi:hypothetical protein